MIENYIMFKPRNILIQVIIIGLFLWVPIYITSLPSRHTSIDITPFWKSGIIRNVMIVCFFYANFLFLIPTLYIAKKWGWYILTIFICLNLIIWIPNLLIFNAWTPIFPKGGGGHYHDTSLLNKVWMEVRDTLYLYISILTLSILFRLNIYFKQLQAEKLNSELSYLKAQINPHFLFNSLNSIYSLAIVKSPKTPTAIIKLSSMMRYVISDTANRFVSLEKEINYINSYIELQKIRLDDTASVNYTFSGEIENKKIAPLLLIPFIENAFKHGVNPEEVSQIDIQISVSETSLYLHVFNLKVPHIQDLKAISGFGLKNSQEQLSLLYSKKHELKIDDKEHSFTVTLKIDIS
jgi:sensor histidine kinase YesM